MGFPSTVAVAPSLIEKAKVSSFALKSSVASRTTALGTGSSETSEASPALSATVAVNESILHSAEASFTAYIVTVSK